MRISTSVKVGLGNTSYACLGSPGHPDADPQIVSKSNLALKPSTNTPCLVQGACKNFRNGATTSTQKWRQIEVWTQQRPFLCPCAPGSPQGPQRCQSEGDRLAKLQVWSRMNSLRAMGDGQGLAADEATHPVANTHWNSFVTFEMFEIPWVCSLFVFLNSV